MVWNNCFNKDLSWRDCLQLKSQIQKPLAHDVVVVVQLLSCVRLFVGPHGLQHTRLPCPHYRPVFTQIHVHWVSDAIQPSLPLSLLLLCLQSFPASGSFPMSQLSISGGQSIGVSASTSVLPMNTQDWSPLGWTGWISLQSKGLSRVCSSATVQKHQFFGAQPSL